MSADTVVISQRATIVRAAIALTAEGRDNFTAEDLTARAYEMYPAVMGLKGYESKYPDNKKVSSLIMGERGLTKRGCLVQLGTNLYRLGELTDEERAAVTADDNPTKKVVMPQNREPVAKTRARADAAAKTTATRTARLVALLDSLAAYKYAMQKSTIIFEDALAFWGLPASGFTQGAADTNRLGVHSFLREMEQLVGEQGLTLPCGRFVDPGSVRALRNLDSFLGDRFGRRFNSMKPAVA